MNWLQILGPSMLMIFGGIITWILKSRVDEFRAIEEKLRIERRKIYFDILEPFITLFTDPKKTKEAKEKIISQKYKKTAFELILLGSDDVVKAYNALMTHAYEAERIEKQNPKEMLKLLGNLLLEIRKNLGNKKSDLIDFDMLRAMIKDIEKM